MPGFLPLLVLLGFGGTAVAAPTSDTHTVQRLVSPSPFHGVHGLAFDRNDVLYAGSVVGHSIYRVDTRTGDVTTFVGAPEGMADDLVFLADGTVVWTAISQGVVRARRGDGPIRELARLVSINSVNVRPDGRLFAGQVFGGDGVWELDPQGVKAPRSVTADPGGFNGFDIGPDGELYGPLWFRKQVVRIHPDTGRIHVVATGFDTPAAANFDSKGNLYVLDTARGEVIRVDIRTGDKQRVAQLEPSLDNLAFDSHDRLFVSNMADNGIQEVDVKTGKARQVVKGQLAMPMSLAFGGDAGKQTLYVADVFAFRKVDAKSGDVTDIARSHAAGSPIEYPVAVTANDAHVLLVNNDGVVQRYDRRTMKVLHEWHDFAGVQTALELADGSLILAETAAGKLSRTQVAQGTKRRDLAAGLGAPLGLAASRDGAVFVSEAAGGRLSRVDPSTGKVTVVATGLDRPQGIAVDEGGDVLVVEVGAQRLVSVRPGDGKKTVIARDLPIGLPNVALTTVGVTAGPDGSIYVTSDIENSIWKLAPKR
jgi:sugar lactone lactonase YvrE